jgi:hypothetical protein
MNSRTLPDCRKEAADSLAKKGARILQTHSNDSYHSVKLYVRQLFNKLQKEDIEQKIKDKNWEKDIVQVPDWPRNHQLLFLH